MTGGRTRCRLRSGSSDRVSHPGPRPPGDRVAVVDQLGIPVDVTSPIDGIVGPTLVEAGDAVEYGEALVVVEPHEDDG
jgi:acetyl/propionyl-CoA carboxylase alpha subunit